MKLLVLTTLTIFIAAVLSLFVPDLIAILVTAGLMLLVFAGFAFGGWGIVQWRREGRAKVVRNEEVN